MDIKTRTKADEKNIVFHKKIINKYTRCDNTLIHSSIESQIKLVSQYNVDVLLEGETGTGKDKVARQIYSLSQCNGKFVAVNCAAIPETLAESELFGASSGAFTGATTSRGGYIEEANNGILFLDEIDSMSLTLQSKLLRVIENRYIYRLGCTKKIKVNIRIIAAAQKCLSNLVDQNKFRLDLYFRLSTIKITMPTLRECPEYIIPMFKQFVQESMEKYKLEPEELSSNTESLLLAHNWRGNIRELKSAAERYVLGFSCLDEGQEYESKNAQHTVSDSQRTLHDIIKEFETRVIKRCLSDNNNNIAKTVKELGISRRTLYNKLSST